MAFKDTVQAVFPKESKVYQVGKKPYLAIVNTAPARRVRDVSEVRKWKKAGRQLPAPAPLKHGYLRSLRRKFNTGTLIETGTFQGDTVYAMKDAFNRIVTIEVQPALYEKAKARFAEYGHIETLLGDSAELITDLVKKLDKPTLFWLDAHHSAGVTGRGAEDSSLSKEFDVIIEAINKTGLKHVILLDDARDFWGTEGYPTLIGVFSETLTRLPGYVFEVKDGIAFVYPG